VSTSRTSARQPKRSSARTEANRAAYQAADVKNFDTLTFNAWFTAYVAGNKNAIQVAERRFRPQFLVALNAWFGTYSFHEPPCTARPTYMPRMSSRNWPRPTCLILAPITATRSARQRPIPRF
jgi:hypothetical protein